jgi:hypothetical protein
MRIRDLRLPRAFLPGGIASALWRMKATAKREWDLSEAIVWLATGNEDYLHDVSTANVYLRQYLPRQALNCILLAIIRYQLGSHLFDVTATNLLEQLELGRISAVRHNWEEGQDWADVVPARLHINPPNCRFVAREVRRSSLGEREPRRGREKGAGGYEKDDQLLVDAIINLAESGVRPFTACGVMAECAKGGGTLESKRTRLYRRYKASLTPQGVDD